MDRPRWKLVLFVLNLTVLLCLIFFQLRLKIYHKAIRPPRYQILKTYDIETQHHSLRNVSHSKTTKEERPLRYQIPKTYDIETQHHSLRNVSHSKTTKEERPLRYQIPKTYDIETQHHSLRNVFHSKTTKEERNHDLNKVLFFSLPQHWFDDWIENKWDTSLPFSSCPVSNCVLTKQLQYMDKADAVIFQVFPRTGCLKNCKKKKKLGQVWIIFEHEPPTRYGEYRDLNKRCHRNLFNWTITYRRDSDFTFVHGQFSKVSSPYNENAIDLILKAKTKTAVGFISHCPVPSRRREYITKLRKYGIDIDIYGKCGNLQCDSGLNHRHELKLAWNLAPVDGLKRDCFDVLDSRYKFYLSFENSLCDDYVTEKSLHLVLRHNIVPIIRDASNRTLFSPPKSYLDTKDFHDVKSLATRIKFLSNNLDEYKKYFLWKKYFSPETTNGVLQSILCNICERLHNQHKYKRIYRNVVDFLFSRGTQSPVCHEPADI